jgi:hypothetical protein
MRVNRSPGAVVTPLVNGSAQDNIGIPVRMIKAIKNALMFLLTAKVQNIPQRQPAGTRLLDEFTL